LPAAQRGQLPPQAQAQADEDEDGERRVEGAARAPWLAAPRARRGALAGRWAGWKTGIAFSFGTCP
jgi:hypothetical protein